MGRASRWFRFILGLKKPDPSSHQHQPPTSSSCSFSKEKRRWSFVKSYREKDQLLHQNATSNSGLLYGHEKAELRETEGDETRRAIEVAAATAAVAEAVVAAAQAAAEVVRLTSGGPDGKRAAVHGRGGNGAAVSRELHDVVAAAIKIQSAFRGYLARRALRALRALVRLQALVRGHIERKRTAEWLHQMQSLLRAQARARAGRIQFSESLHSSSKSSQMHHPGPPTPEKFEHAIRAKSGKYDQSMLLKRTGSKSNGRTLIDQPQFSFPWSDHGMEEHLWDRRVPFTSSGNLDYEKSDKNLEIDTGKPHSAAKRRNLLNHRLPSEQYSRTFATSKELTVPSPLSGEIQSLRHKRFSREVEEAFCTAENSPQYYSTMSVAASDQISPFTTRRSDGSKSLLSGSSDFYPNYMSYTESSRAKVRSVSAPKQRPQYERSSSTKGCSIGEPRSSSAQRSTIISTSFPSKAYPGSGRLDSLGMPIGQRY